MFKRWFPRFKARFQVGNGILSRTGTVTCDDIPSGVILLFACLTPDERKSVLQLLNETFPP